VHGMARGVSGALQSLGCAALRRESSTRDMPMELALEHAAAAAALVAGGASEDEHDDEALRQAPHAPLWSHLGRSCPHAPAIEAVMRWGDPVSSQIPERV